VEGKLILEQSLGKQGVSVWIGFIWLRIWYIEGSFEDGNEP
jgi:hypothetical protein